MQFALLIFAVLTIVGALAGWRKSPLYSFKATVKLIGAFLLIVVVVMGASQFIVSRQLSQSPVVAGVEGFLAILALGCISSVIVVRITDAHVAQLPPSTKLVSFNRHKVYRWIWRLLIFVLINVAAALALPVSLNWLPIGLGGFMLLLCGPMLSIGYMMARRNDRGMTAVMANPWAHWQYAPEKWTQWAENQREWEKSQEGPWSWKRVLLFVLLCVGLFSLGTLFSGGSLQEKLIILCGLTAFIILLVLVAFWFKRTNFDRRYRRLLAAAPEAWFGDEGLFCNGIYMPWNLSGKYLLKATVTTDPPAHLNLIFQSFNGSSSTTTTYQILIPPEPASDLQLLQQKIKSQCPTASVHLITT
jgi:hypothetical protein